MATRREIDDRKSSVAKRAGPIGPNAGVIRTAVCLGREKWFHIARDDAATKRDYASDSTHARCASLVVFLRPLATHPKLGWTTISSRPARLSQPSTSIRVYRFSMGAENLSN